VNQTILARFKIIDGKESEADEAMKTMAAAVEKSESGALTYIFARNRKDPSEVTVFEIYSDDDTFKAHGASPHMGTFRSYFGPIFDAATVKVERLEQIAGFQR